MRYLGSSVLDSGRPAPADDYRNIYVQKRL